MRQLVREVRARFADRPPRVMVGGGAFCALPNPAAAVGANGFGADLRAAVALSGS